MATNKAISDIMPYLTAEAAIDHLSDEAEGLMAAGVDMAKVLAVFRQRWPTYYTDSDIVARLERLQKMIER